MLLLREMKEQCCRLEPGCSALYAWQNPLGKRELVWRCPDKNEDFRNELVKVPAALLNLC